MTTNPYYDSLVNASAQQSAVASMNVSDRCLTCEIGEIHDHRLCAHLDR
jgi:hypothetical protein